MDAFLADPALLPLRALLVLFLTADSIWELCTAILSIIGCWGIFKKCGLPGWHALLPGLREYQLACCGGREGDGRVYSTLRVAAQLLGFFSLFLDPGSIGLTMLSVIALLISIGILIYFFRVSSGLCDVFGRKKGWVVLWIISYWVPIAPVLWGWLKKFQPAFKVQDVQAKVDNYFSGAEAAVMDEGLTVNIEERTATEFFKKKYLLRDVHMYIKPGHMVLLLGGSGAGKTTLLNAINGYEPAKAQIHLNGGNVYKDYKHMQYEIGFVPQLDLMRGSDTVLHTLRDGAALRLPDAFNKAERDHRVDEVMDIFGLKPVKNNLVDKLSGGQRKRLSIALEFLSNPSLFILDEPDSGLDGVMARELMQQLRQIANQGKIVLVITHTPDRVIDLFDDVIVLAKDQNRTGRLAYFGPIDEAKTFFERDSMEKIVRSINRKEEGGDGLADELIKKYAEVQHEIAG